MGRKGRLTCTQHSFQAEGRQPVLVGSRGACQCGQSHWIDAWHIYRALLGALEEFTWTGKKPMDNPLLYPRKGTGTGTTVQLGLRQRFQSLHPSPCKSIQFFLSLCFRNHIGYRQRSRRFAPRNAQCCVADGRPACTRGLPSGAPNIAL